MRWNFSFSPLAVILAAALALSGCASKCKQALTKCRYECQRNYQLCQVKNTDVWYCQIQYGNCDVKCDDDNKSCSNWHFW